MQADGRSQSSAAVGLAERLERGEVIEYPVCPFPLFCPDDHAFLLAQELGRGHKNIGCDPNTSKASGFARRSAAQAERLRQLFLSFSSTVTAWTGEVLPRYRDGWRLDRVSYRPEEEATRVLRRNARNDLLHVDAFPSRPTNGWRILRVFVNVNPSEPRVWITSEPFARLLQRYGEEVGLPGRETALGWAGRLLGTLPRLFQPGRKARSAYDAFMLRFHNFLKANEEFQERCPKRVWNFAPCSVWLAMTDTASHAVLRGRYALEHSYFISPKAQALPDESPAALLEKACGRPVLAHAA